MEHALLQLLLTSLSQNIKKRREINEMKQNILKSLMGFAMLLLATQAQALLITPSTTSLVPDGCGGDAACLAAASSTSASVIRTYIEDTYDVVELYKSESGAASGEGDDEGAFAGVYDTEFANSTTDPEDAWIEFVGDAGDEISCPDCYLLVKDGNHQPAWYLFDIGTWDGMEDIHLEDFWLGGGAISHIAIYGGEHNVPEPGILALLGLGLVGIFVSRRKVK